MITSLRSFEMLATFYQSTLLFCDSERYSDGDSAVLGLFERAP